MSKSASKTSVIPVVGAEVPDNPPACAPWCTWAKGNPDHLESWDLVTTARGTDVEAIHTCRTGTVSGDYLVHLERTARWSDDDEQTHYETRISARGNGRQVEFTPREAVDLGFALLELGHKANAATADEATS